MFIVLYSEAKKRITFSTVYQDKYYDLLALSGDKLSSRESE